MNSLSIRIGIAALTLFVVAGCASDMKAEPFPDVPDDMKSGPGLFTGQSGDFDLAAASRGEPQGGASDTSDFEEWKRGRGSADDDLSSWLGDEGSAASQDSPRSSEVADATPTGLENDPEYREYLEYKRWKEFRDFQEWKRQQSQ